MKGCLLILRRDSARSGSHDNMTFYYEGLVDDFEFCGLHRPTRYRDHLPSAPERSGDARLEILTKKCSK